LREKAAQGKAKPATDFWNEHSLTFFVFVGRTNVPLSPLARGKGIKSNSCGYGIS
jgi:hypothetical protein